MEHDSLDRLIDYGIYIKNLSTSDLVELIKRLENYEEVSSALTELSQRDKTILIPLCHNILQAELGDEYLQAIAFNLLYTSDREKAMEWVKVKLESVFTSVLGEIFDNLSTDSLQPFGLSLSSEFLQSLADRYFDFSDDDKKRIYENYEWFKESYKDKLS
ncbi:hypothetical protein ACE3NQ_10885 [Paenibacillus terreus]|uniref:Immunity protein 30 domain-containing protein n=1 Tax=Paenibacillus terreus TaxID=1387834 RepID=A0ABV5BA09_9BACL